MSEPRPFSVEAVGVRTVGAGEYDAVSARIGDRLAGTLVVHRGHGEVVARLLLAAPLMAAARRLADVARAAAPAAPSPPAAGRAISDVLSALRQIDREPLRDDVVPVIEDARPGPRPVRDVNPVDALERAMNQLFTGNPEGKTGDSMFRAVVVAGTFLKATPNGGEPVPLALSAYDETSPESIRPLTARLRELADRLDQQFVAHELQRAGVVRTCRVCGCTDDDCSQCVEKTGGPCHWIAADLCSACRPRTRVSKEAMRQLVSVSPFSIPQGDAQALKTWLRAFHELIAAHDAMIGEIEELEREVTP